MSVPISEESDLAMGFRITGRFSSEELMLVLALLANLPSTRALEIFPRSVEKGHLSLVTQIPPLLGQLLLIKASSQSAHGGNTPFTFTS